MSEYEPRSCVEITEEILCNMLGKDWTTTEGTTSRDFIVLSEPIMSRDEIIRVIESTADENYEEIHVSDNLLVAVPLEQSTCERKVIYIEFVSAEADECICMFDYEIDGMIRALQKAKAMLEK